MFKLKKSSTQPEVGTWKVSLAFELIQEPQYNENDEYICSLVQGRLNVKLQKYQLLNAYALHPEWDNRYSAYFYGTLEETLSQADKHFADLRTLGNKYNVYSSQEVLEGTDISITEIYNQKKDQTDA